MVILGAASPFISIPFNCIENAIRTLFGRKGEDIIGINLKAFRAGRDFSANLV
jgi:indolepyruvate ferredoxin oxidoreductase beta subunit